MTGVHRTNTMLRQQSRQLQSATITSGDSGQYGSAVIEYDKAGGSRIPARYLQVDIVVAQQAVQEDADQPHHPVLLHLVLHIT